MQGYFLCLEGSLTLPLTIKGNNVTVHKVTGNAEDLQEATAKLINLVYLLLHRLRGCMVRSVHGQSSSFMGTMASEKGANFREQDRGRRGVKDRDGEKEGRRGRRG
ncbi:unnamed protein product [Gulo gulo]|uniref:Uncharacterized protein n=1 Tax=Gulo gulo TaxID=48420 RepID=A0A9X9PYQ0_GULGU|nr:unnamed protein product [Gulo gulo]